MQRIVWTCALALGLLACGDDSGDAAMPCPDGVEAGGVAICECPDESIGSALCGEDMKLGECACAGSPDAGAGGGGSGGSAPVGSSGSGGAAPSTGGTAPPDLSDAGAGMMPVDAGDMGSPPPMVVEPPTDANQQSLCEDDRDCNAGLGCYTGGGGRNFCTATCESDEDCAGLTGGEFTCGTSGLCRVTCEGSDDTASCPDGMACIESGFMFPGGGPIGGGTATCKWPEEGAAPGDEAGGAYAECMMDSDCGDGLECIGGGAMSFFGSVGYCATACQDDGDCDDQPASGGIDPTCEANSPVSGVCALDCSGGASEDCPDGMNCVETAFASRCGYN